MAAEMPRKVPRWCQFPARLAESGKEITWRLQTGRLCLSARCKSLEGKECSAEAAFRSSTTRPVFGPASGTTRKGSQEEDSDEV
jgi:hypothetical protein